MLHQQLWQNDPVLIAAALVLLGIAIGGIAVSLLVLWTEDDEETVDEPPGEVEADGGYEDAEIRTLPEPNLKTATFGPPQKLLRLYRTHRKKKKLTAKGYVQWHLIDGGTFPTPKFVKPHYEGGGVPELKHGGNRYLFPKKAMLPDDETGMWTVVHKAGEADPYNLTDPTKYSIPNDALEEYLQMRTTDSPPSFFDKFDLDAEEVFKWGMILLIGGSVLYGILGGGI